MNDSSHPVEQELEEQQHEEQVEEQVAHENTPTNGGSGSGKQKRIIIVLIAVLILVAGVTVGAVVGSNSNGTSSSSSSLTTNSNGVEDDANSISEAETEASTTVPPSASPSTVPSSTLSSNHPTSYSSHAPTQSGSFDASDVASAASSSEPSSINPIVEATKYPTPAPVATTSGGGNLTAPPTAVVPLLTPAPLATTRPGGNLTSTPTLAPSNATVPPPTSTVNGGADPTAGNNAPGSVTAGNARIARYQIEWSQSHQACELKSYILTVSCPVGVIDLSTTASISDNTNCIATSDRTLECQVRSSNTLAVGCYGLTEQDDVRLSIENSASAHTCSEATSTDASAIVEVVVTVSGSIRLATEIISMDCAADPSAITMFCAPLTFLDNPPGCEATGICDAQLTCLPLVLCMPSCNIGVGAGRIASVESIKSDCIQLFDIKSKPLGDTTCLYNIQCESNVCSYGVCQEPLPDRSFCEESQDCLNQVCAYQDASYTETVCCTGGLTIESNGNQVCSSTAENGALCDKLHQVCVSGACGLVAVSEPDTTCCEGGTTFGEVFYGRYADYCYNEALAGSDCGPNLNSLCASGVCVSSVCVSGLLASGEDCEDSTDCESGACGRLFVNAAVKTCCEGSTTFGEVLYGVYSDYCYNMALEGSNCGPNFNNVCASGVCAGSVCASGLLASGDDCSNHGDCESGACGRLFVNAAVKTCCEGSTTFAEVLYGIYSDYCYNMAMAGSNCGPNFNNLCASGVCVGSVCASGLLASGEDCSNHGDCESGACGRIFVNAAVKTCCEGSTTFGEVLYGIYSNYCYNEALAGLNCGPNFRNVCASGVCTASTCE
jgi:hypothetical protein